MVKRFAIISKDGKRTADKKSEVQAEMMQETIGGKNRMGKHQQPPRIDPNDR